MNNLFEEFKELPLPESREERSYSAKAIDGFDNHRIAKDKNGNPNLLIGTVPKERLNAPDQRLYNLSIIYDLSCEIEAETGIETGNFTIVTYEGNDTSLLEHFLAICETLVVSLGILPTKEKIADVTSKFIELFRAFKEPPRTTIQGLWSELFVISQSSIPSTLIEAWHSTPEEKYDFSHKQSRVEVKSSGSRIRTHHFSFDQLNPPSETQLYVVSLFSELVSNGVSINDLMSGIEENLKDHRHVEKLRLISYSTLGSSLNQINDVRFDFNLANDSMRIYDSLNVPKILTTPPKVSDVRFKSSLEEIDSMNIEIDTIFS